MKIVNKLTPFGKFCCTFGNLPTSYMESLTYEQQLLWLCRYLEETVLPTINENAEATIELQKFYEQLRYDLDHLDLQDEVNHKMDELVEDGTIQGILMNYALVSKTLNSVVDMISDSTLVENQKVKTLGYYSLGDCEPCDYVITATQSENKYQIALDNGLYATMILKNVGSPEEFGAKGDNLTDDTQAFMDLFAHYDNISLKNKNYKMVYFNTGDHKIIEGNGATLNCLLNTSNLLSFGSHSVINNLNVVSLNPDREWNRISFLNQNDLIFNNCSFSGFNQVISGEEVYNVWALYFRDCHDITLNNCNFDDNVFEDILIERGSYNIILNNCGTNTRGVKVDIEGVQAGVNSFTKNIAFNNCILDLLHTYNYYNDYVISDRITFTNCVISNFSYHGGNLIFDNCHMVNYSPSTFIQGSGNVEFRNSMNFSKNLISDNYFDTLTTNKNSTVKKWYVAYSTGSFFDMAKSENDPVYGRYINVNYLTALSKSCQISSIPVDVKPNTQYLLETLSKAKYPTGSPTGSTSKQLRVIFYNDTTELSRQDYSINYGLKGSETPFNYSDVIISTPASCNKLEIVYKTSDAQSNFGLLLVNSSLYEMTFNEELKNNIQHLPFRTKAVFESESIPTSTNIIQHYKGDIMYYTNPTTHIGAVCIEDESRNWKNFGEIAQ